MARGEGVRVGKEVSEETGREGPAKSLVIAGRQLSSVHRKEARRGVHQVAGTTARHHLPCLSRSAMPLHSPYCFWKEVKND
ncbi:hypothetical protein E2C01_031945 [Portunus trituberculatus]|uniref:Uncharacterized protein n=1 Tax=Portunus trituberculatus TaxID=210409 RepID=A0A5B7EZK5_PORTR|nr:hypothetical protein [Portunus trituberculatus]